MSEFKLEKTDRGFMHLVFTDCHQREVRLIEVSCAMEPRVYFGTGDNLVFNQQTVKTLLPYLQEFAATGHFGRHPIQRAFTDPRIERLAESDPLLASVRRHILQEVADDDTATVQALVRLLMAYSELTTEAVRQVTSLREELQDTVFAGIKNPLGGDDGG